MTSGLRPACCAASHAADPVHQPVTPLQGAALSPPTTPHPERSGVPSVVLPASPASDVTGMWDWVLIDRASGTSANQRQRKGSVRGLVAPQAPMRSREIGPRSRGRGPARQPGKTGGRASREANSYRGRKRTRRGAQPASELDCRAPLQLQLLGCGLRHRHAAGVLHLPGGQRPVLVVSRQPHLAHPRLAGLRGSAG